MKTIRLCILFLLVSQYGTAQDFLSGLDGLYQLPDGVQTRWADAENPDAKPGEGAQANFGRKGSPSHNHFKAGESFVMAHAEGSGTVRRIWITINDRSPKMLRGILLKMYWDGAEKPAVQAPLGDFFCESLGTMTAFENALFSSPEARSFICLVPMPFRKGMKIVAVNESDKDLEMFFYEVDFTVGDKHGPETPYFHSYYRRENPTRMQKDFEILPSIQGRGRFLGCSMGVITNREYGSNWWGEGEVKIYLDGDREYPTLAGTGTEDYIGTGWGLGPYANLYQGCPLVNHEQGRYGFYRLHIPDPVYFSKEIRVTIQQLGGADRKESIRALEAAGKSEYTLGGDGSKKLSLDELKQKTEGWWLIERTDDWCATSYFYLDRPENDLPPIEPFADRVKGL